VKTRAEFVSIVELKEQTTALQVQLAYFKDSASQFSSIITCPACKMENGVITSRCWTHEREAELVLRVRELVLRVRELEQGGKRE